MTVLGLDHLIVAARDLERAVADWSAMLGRAPSWEGRHPALGTRNALFRFGASYLELLAADPASQGGFLADLVRDVLGDREERAFGLALAVDDVDAAAAELRGRGLGVLDPAPGEGVDSRSGAVRTWRSALVDPATVRGLRMLLIRHSSPADLLPPAAVLDSEPGAACDALDHLVVFTEDLAASRDLWGRIFGLPEAWARDFPERGTRNLAFDLGGTVLELIQRTDRAPRLRGDTLWGAAWRVGDAEGAVARVARAGFSVDPPRAGLLAGTVVATVRWPRTPTLLIAPSRQ